MFLTFLILKQVYLSAGEDSSKSSESRESNSSEDSTHHVGPAEEPLQQPAFTETGLPSAMEGTDPPGATTLLPSADEASAVTLNASALPDPEHPQTSTDTSLIPDDPSQTALGFDISQNISDSDPGQVSLDVATEHILPDSQISLLPGLMETDIFLGAHAANQPQVTTLKTYQGFSQGVTPPFPPHISRSTPPPSFTATPLPIHIGTAMTGVPICFSFQFTTPEPEPPRGDNI